MSKTLTAIAEQLRDANKKVQLIYAFNGTGKTRLSRAFKALIAPKAEGEEAQASDLANKKVLYYSAFTEDLFYWQNDLERDVEPKLIIQPIAFTRWVLEEQGQDQSTTATFQGYTSDKLTPQFSNDFSSVSFSFERGNEQPEPHIKISKGEESNFISSVFNALLEQLISEINIAEAENRSTDAFNKLEYVFIDDPVSSLDENHLIELAVNLAGLIKTSQSTDLKFIITTHSPLSNEAIAQPTPAVQATVKLLLDNLKNSHGFWQQQGA